MAQPAARKTVELFYDVVSPYAWIGFETLCRYKTKWNIDLQLKPFFLGGVMKASDNRPPMMVPAKGAYMPKDLHRLRSYYQVPLKAPKDPFNTMVTKGTLAAQRLLTAVTIYCPNYTESVSRELWLRIWSRDEDITTPESFTQALKSAGLKDPEIASLLKATSDAAVKSKLLDVTKDAIELGAFGAPTIVVRDDKNVRQMLWGSDRIEVLAWMLGEKYEGPLRELAASKL